MLKHVVKVAIGSLMIVVVFIGYIPQPEYCVELTCISNLLGGLLLLADGILAITKKKHFPNAFYFNVAVSLLTVFLVCMGSFTGIYHFNFKGAFFFMHVINPIVFIGYYIVFTKERSQKIRLILTAPILFMAYCLFDYLRCQVTGEFVYGFVDPQNVTLLYAIGAGLILYVLMCLLGLILFSLNRLVHQKAADPRQPEL